MRHPDSTCFLATIRSPCLGWWPAFAVMHTLVLHGHHLARSNRPTGLSLDVSPKIIDHQPRVVKPQTLFCVIFVQIFVEPCHANLAFDRRLTC